MARGWESKSIESQQAEAFDAPVQQKRRLTPQEVAVARQREGLLLSRKHILDEIQSAPNPRRREMLEGALTELDARLAALR